MIRVRKKIQRNREIRNEIYFVNIIAWWMNPWKTRFKVPAKVNHDLLSETNYESWSANEKHKEHLREQDEVDRSDQWQCDEVSSLAKPRYKNKRHKETVALREVRHVLNDCSKTSIEKWIRKSRKRMLRTGEERLLTTRWEHRCQSFEELCKWQRCFYEQRVGWFWANGEILEKKRHDGTWVFSWWL